jgi:hypothetical protein
MPLTWQAWRSKRRDAEMFHVGARQLNNHSALQLVSVSSEAI